tara:strand:+ start:3959 stop:4717 length:759 start_codon:yes stop_codon:yes gene_type:complete
MNENNYLKNEIMNQFNTLLHNFFMKIAASSINNYKLNMYFQIGIQTFIKVFEYILFHTKSLEKAHVYTEKSEILFIEYLEQIQEADYDMNINDVVLFIYKKTIFKIKEQEQEADIINNIMTLSDTSIQFDEKHYNETFTYLNKVTNTLFYWNNPNITTNNRIEICQKFIDSFYLLHINENVLLFLDYIQQNHKMDYPSYKILLKEIIDIYKKNKMKKLDDDFFIRMFVIEKENVDNKFRNLNPKQFIKWILT